MFNSLRPLARIASELRRIANSLEYFAIEDARRNNRIYIARRASRFAKDESELLHTDDDLIAKLRDEERALVQQRGYPEVEAHDLIDEAPQE